MGKEEQYLDVLEKQLLITSGFMVAEQFVSFKLIGYFQRHDECFYGELTNNIIWSNFKIALKSILLIIPGILIIKQVFMAPSKSYFSFKFQNLLYEAVSEKWLIGEVPLKILQKKDTEVLIDNLNKDIATITDDGEGLRVSFLNGITKSIYSQFLMYQYNAQDLIIFYQLYYGCTQYISEELSKWKTFYNNEIRILESKKNMLMKHDTRNVEAVALRNGFAYSFIVLKKVNDELRIIASKKLMVTHFCDMWKVIEKYTQTIVTAFSIGYKVRINELDSDVKLKVWMASRSISSLMGWKGQNAGTIEETKNSIKKLLDFVDKIKNFDVRDGSNLKKFEHKGNGLILKDLSLNIEDRILFYIKELTLNSGKYYALTGASGSGKSSLFAKIKGIMHDGINATGSIGYPKGLEITKEIVLMPQNDFFPIDVTLLDAIYYPRQIPLDQREEIHFKVLAILQKVNLCNMANEYNNTCNIEKFLAVKKDWNNVLSGGQKKKALIASVLIQNYKMLLLDEPFTGLHQEAIHEMQLFIKETLLYTNTLVICIDHHVSDSRNFYDFELHIENKSLELSDI